MTPRTCQANELHASMPIYTAEQWLSNVHCQLMGWLKFWSLSGVHLRGDKHWCSTC